MMQFNILGKGFIDMEDPTTVGFKSKNPWFCFADVELGRSTEFSIPANEHNRQLLGFGEDPAEYGDDLRTKHLCQMIYDGGIKDGSLTFTAYEGDGFKCVFETDNANWIEKLQKMKLSEVPIGNHSVVWDTGTPVNDADSVTPSPSDFVKLVKYENGVSSPSWQLVPAVHVFSFTHAILTALDVPFNVLTVQPDSKHWLIAGSMKNGVTESVTLSQNDTLDAQISPASTLLSVTTTNIEWAKGLVFGAYVGGGSTSVQCFKAERDMKVTFGTVPPDVYLIKWNMSLKKCRCLGGYPSGSLPDWVSNDLEMLGSVGQDLSGQSVDFKKDEVFFFSDYFGNIITSNYFTNQQIIPGEGYFGWKDTLHPFNVAVELSADADLQLGETWMLRYNMPDMTVFEFLKSVALSSVREMAATPSDFSMIAGFYGLFAGNQYFKAIDKVVSLDRVERTAWGNTRHAVVKFDSEDYVTDPITTDYEVPNANLEDTDEHVVKFSEGEQGANGILVKDAAGSPLSFSAKKWTLARVDTAAADPTYLQRVEAPDDLVYDDIAANSTCVTLKAVMTLADFLALQPYVVLTWRGMGYVWKDANWSQDVATLTLQRVSAITTQTPNWLSFEAVTANAEVGFYMDDFDNAQTFLPSLEYSVDGGLTWQAYTINRSINDPTVADMITLANIGDKVLFRGNNAYVTTPDAHAMLRCVITGQVNGGGDLTSLLNGVGGDVALTHYAFISMFYVNCAGLKTAPNLPSTTLGNYCYANLFAQTGITSAVLPARVLKDHSYSNTFRYCSQLTEVVTYMEDITAPSCIQGWLFGVAATGTLTCDASLTLTAGTDYPSGWTRANL